MPDLEKRTADLLVIANVSEVGLAKMTHAYCSALVVRPSKLRLSGILGCDRIVQGITEPYTVTWQRGVLPEEQIGFTTNRYCTSGKLQIGEVQYEIHCQPGRRIVSAELKAEFESISDLDDKIREKTEAWIKEHAVPMVYTGREPGKIFRKR